MKFKDLPVKSALSQMRQRISFHFFKDLFTRQIQSADKIIKTWNGLRVYAIDGIQFTLPRTKDIASALYSGRKVSNFPYNNTVWMELN